MTPAEFKAIRKSLSLSTVEMGRAIGYEGQNNTVSVTVRKYESGGRPIPPWIARLMQMYGRYGTLEIDMSREPIMPVDIDMDGVP